MTQRISSEVDTKPYNPVPTLRFPECAVCRRACSAEDGEFAFHVALPPVVPNVGATTAHGRFIDALIKRRFVGATICIHGSTMSVVNDRDTLSLLVQLLSERDRLDLDWARAIADSARAALERMSVEGG